MADKIYSYGTRRNITTILIILMIILINNRGIAMDINILQFKNIIQHKDTVILDVRTPEEFESGHIKGSINIDFLSDNFEQMLSTLDKTKSYAIICKSGNRSEKAQDTMATAGFEKLYNLLGGLSNKSNIEQLEIVK